MSLRGGIFSALLLLLAVRPADATAPAPPPGTGATQSGPVALDWINARYADYFAEIERRVQSRWDYRCVKTGAPRARDDLAARLVVEFALRASGELRYAIVLRPPGEMTYDDAALGAIRRASPWPAAPSGMIDDGKNGLVIRTTFTYILPLRPTSPTAMPRWWLSPSAIAGGLVGLLASALAWFLWDRGRVSRKSPTDHGQIAARDARGVSSTTEPPDARLAHDALLLHGWQLDGEVPLVATYSHADLPGHRVDVTLTGAWQHTAASGGSAHGASADDMARYLGAIHGTLSIADLHLPGRREGSARRQPRTARPGV